jgi:hypothetical protein
MRSAARTVLAALAYCVIASSLATLAKLNGRSPCAY